MRIYTFWLAINCGRVKLKEKIRHKHGMEVTLVVADRRVRVRISRVLITAAVVDESRGT